MRARGIRELRAVAAAACVAGAVAAGLGAAAATGADPVADGSAPRQARPGGAAAPRTSARAMQGDRSRRAAPPSPEPAAPPESVTGAPATPRPVPLVRGRVSDADGGVPPGAAVRLPSEASGGTCHGGYRRYRGTTSAAADGSFEWFGASGFPPWEEVVRPVVVEADGLVPAVAGWVERDGDPVDVGTVRLLRGAAVGGVVCAADGSPVCDAEVALTPDGDSPPEEWSLTRGEASRDRTGRDGRFGFVALPTGRPGAPWNDRWRVRCTRPGSPPYLVVASGADDARIVLPAECVPRRVEVAVRAVGPAGSPVPSFECSLVGVQGGIATADGIDGTARVGLTTWGPVRLRVEREPENQVVWIDAVESRDEPYLVRFGPTYELRGVAVCAERSLSSNEPGGRTSAPWASAESVTADGGRDASRCVPGEAPSAPVRDDGTFALVVPSAGLWRITVGENGWGGDPWSVRGATVVVVGDAGGPAEVVVRVHPTVTLRIDVEGPDGAPLDAWWGGPVLDDVSAPGGLREASTRVLRTRAAFGGGLECAEVPADRPVRLRVRGRTADGETLRSDVRVESPGRAAAEGPVRVRLDRGLAIDGVVVRADGSPVPAARVAAERPGAPPGASEGNGPGRFPSPADEGATALTDTRGRFRLTGLAAGDWALAAESVALASSGPATVRAGSSGVRIVAAPRRFAD